SKPWDDYEIEAALRAAVELFLLRSENQRLLAALREQQTAFDRQQSLLLNLEAEHPGITRAVRDAAGAVPIDYEALHRHARRRSARTQTDAQVRLLWAGIERQDHQPDAATYPVATAAQV